MESLSLEHAVAVMNANKQPEESISFSVFGLKFACSNPGGRTIVIVLALLAFIVIMTLLLKPMVIPGIAALRLTSLFSQIGTKLAGWMKR